jgi:hypothetical protein
MIIPSIDRKESEKEEEIIEETFVVFNIITPICGAFYTDLKLNIDATIKDALEYGKRFFDYNSDSVFLIEDANGQTLNEKELIRNVAEPRDLFIIEAMSFYIESRLEDWPMDSIKLRKGKIYTVGELKSIAKLNGEFCDDDGTVCKDEMILRSKRKLVVVRREQIRCVRVELLDGSVRNYRVDGDTTLRVFRRALEIDVHYPYRFANNAGKILDNSLMIKDLISSKKRYDDKNPDGSKDVKCVTVAESTGDIKRSEGCEEELILLKCVQY